MKLLSIFFYLVLRLIATLLSKSDYGRRGSALVSEERTTRRVDTIRPQLLLIFEIHFSLGKTPSRNILWRLTLSRISSQQFFGSGTARLKGLLSRPDVESAGATQEYIKSRKVVTGLLFTSSWVHPQDALTFDKLNRLKW